jgi:von Willebrand factor type A domain
MDLGFASPAAALLALVALIPLAALLAVRARARGIRQVLRLPEPGKRAQRLPLVALGVAGALIGLAAAQPVLQRDADRLVRTDAEAWVILDTTRSMLAQEDPDSRIRLDRAKAGAQAVKDSLPNVPVGIASLTDRVLPHLFPTTDDDVFRATLERSVAIENPPPRSGFLALVTRLDAVGSLQELNFFNRNTRRRVAVVLTDGESLPFAPDRVARRLSGPPRVDALFVHVWGESERVFTRGVPEPAYRPDPTSRPTLETLASVTGGRVYTDAEAGSAAAKARELIGQGPTIEQGERRVRYALSPYLAGAAFLPLALLLWRRDR